MEEKEKFKEMMEKINSRGKTGMIGIPQQHPMTEEELKELEESYRKALAKKVKNIYQKAGEMRKKK